MICRQGRETQELDRAIELVDIRALDPGSEVSGLPEHHYQMEHLNSKLIETVFPNNVRKLLAEIRQIFQNPYACMVILAPILLT